jgi:hypothetical protein
MVSYLKEGDKMQESKNLKGRSKHEEKSKETERKTGEIRGEIQK